jgi:hypothetical protein
MNRLSGWVVLGVALVGLPGASRADPIVYLTTLSGSAESPPNGSTATGSAEVDYDPVAHTLHVHVTFSGLTGGSASAAHIHSTTGTPLTGNAGVAVPFTGFPSMTSGVYDNTFDLTMSSTYTSAFLTVNGGTAAGAEMGLAAGLAAEKSYANIHNATFPGGEIRGFLVPQAAVPEPATLTLAGVGALSLLGYGWRKRRAA